MPDAYRSPRFGSVPAFQDADRTRAARHSRELGRARRLAAARRQLRPGEVATRLLGRFNAENALVVIACLCPWVRRSPRQPESSPNASRLPGAWKWSKLRFAISPWPWSTTPTRPMRSPRHWAPCASIARARCGACSGAAGPRPRQAFHHGRHCRRIGRSGIVTDDNPRSEDPQDITRAIVSGIKSGRRTGHSRPRRSHRHGTQGSSGKGMSY